MRRAVASIALAGAISAAGCGEGTTVEPEALPADYTDWYRVDTTGAVPGHGDTYRIIYVNENGRSYRGTDRYRTGTIIVKEVHALEDTVEGPQPGALDYVAVMRKTNTAPSGGEIQDGWLFTYLADGVGSSEENRPSCFSTCHVAAPFDHAFLDYGFPHVNADAGPDDADAGDVDIDAGDEADAGEDIDAGPGDIDAG